MPCAPEAAAAAVSREMAATAKQQQHESAAQLAVNRRKPAQPNGAGSNGASGGSKSGDEDIAAIANLISDHAEAIYQTWKSRGLAPTEILNCQAVPTDKFGSVLSSPVTSPQAKKQPPSCAVGDVVSPRDILAQDNNNLEKLVNNFVVEDKARRQRSPSKNLPSSIAFALQKFEQNAAPQQQQQPQAKTPTQLRPTSFVNRVSVVKPQQQHSEVFLETIDAKTTPSGEWPLKTKLKSPTQNHSQSSNANYLDEVAREEERLINALKTGAVIGEVERPKQKPVIARETKPKVEPVKPILISPQALTSAAMVNNVHLQQQQQQVNSPRSETVKTTATSDVLDFAKVRFGPTTQEAPSKTEPIVSVARSKFEPQPVANSAEPAKPAAEKELKDEKDFIASRWGLRLNSSRPRPVEQVPHPELTSQQKQHIRQAATNTANHNPVRPFLTRGSVAERVLIFEKCPSELLLDKRGPRQPATNNAWRTNQQQQPQQQQQQETTAQTKAQTTYPAAKPQPKTLPPHTTLQRHVKTNRNVQIPRFYYPGGKPIPSSQVEATISRITAAFHSLPGHRASRAQFHAITKACDLPLYWKVPLFLASGGDTNGIIEMNEFLDFWKELCKMHHDNASKFVRIVTRGLRTSILPEDLIPLVQDVVETHPGLTFLKEATEFHSRYVHTVIARIFYCVNRSWSGKISVAELRRSNLLSVISILEHEEDINQVTAYFSYEHFYVIYCKFWELDSDHDLFIDKMDLTRHNDHAVSMRMIERIFSGAVTRGVKSANGVQHPEDKMSYTEFVWFLLSEEDKNHPTAIEYWFRCMDLDGDGYLSMYELEYFYEEQLHRMEMIGIETLPFEDCLCQMLDMVKPKIPGRISLCDLKRCKMTSIFFDTFFNLEKYLDHEQRDPFASARDHDAEGHELSDWDRFAAEEYELLVAEESGNDQDDTQIYGIDEDGHIFDKLIEKVKSALSTRPKDSQHDSCDSDDYADSDN